MVRCEDSLLEKEKDSAFLKYTLHELKKSFNEKSEEVDLLKVKNINIENEMKLIKDQNQELKKHFEMKSENLTFKNQLLENILDSFGNQLLHQTKSLEDEQAQMKDMKCEAEDVKNEITEKSKLNQEEIEKVKMQLNISLELSNSINNDVKKLKADVMATSIEIDTGKSQLNEKLNEKTDEINKLSAEGTISGKAVEENFTKLNCELKKQREDINSVRNCQETFVEKFNEKEEEIGTLKVTNINIENEIKLMKDQNEELRIHVERENNDLKNKNQLLETKLDSLGKQLVVEKQLLCNNQSEIINVKTQVGEMKKNLIENMESSQKQSENVEVQLSKLLKFDNSSFTSEVNKLKDEVNKANNEIRATGSHVDKALNKKTDEINKLSARVTTTEQTIYKLNTLNDEVKRLSEHINLMEDNLKGHVTNIENILFCDSSNGCTDILIQWKLQNYQYYFDIGKHVFSPIFLTQIKGYCFKLVVEWSGEKKENLGLYLWVCCGSNYDKPLEPFKMPYSLEVVDNKGNIFSKKTTLSEIETFMEKSFTLPPGQNECVRGCGHEFLSMPDLNNYILNDMLSIQCRLTPS